MSTIKSKTQKLVPLGDKVLVRTIAAETKTKSGIIIPDTVNKERPEQGIVVSVGAGRTTNEGKIVPLNVKIGDVIFFSNHQIEEIKFEEEEYYILSESNILAVIK